MADATVRTYDPGYVILTWGATSFSGYAEGSFIKVDRSGDLFTTVKGADGGVDRVNNNNKVFTVEVTLKQTSPVNEVLAGIMNADWFSNAGVFPLLIKDLRSSSPLTYVFYATQAWISKDPETEYSDAMSNRVWTFSCSGVKIDAGNNGAAAVAAP